MNPGSNCWKEMEEDSSSSATPTALVKIFGDFDTRVKTASRRTGENFGTRQAGSDMKSGHSNILGRKPSFTTNPKGRLVFDELDTPQGQTSSRQKRPSSVLQDPLTGLENYPKAIRTDDTRSMQAEIDRLKMQLIQKDADMIALEADVKHGQAKVKKMEVEIAKDRLVRESEREVQIRNMRMEKHRTEDLKNKINLLNNRHKHEKEYSDLRSKSSNPIQGNSVDEVKNLVTEIDDLKEELYMIKTEHEERDAQFKEQILELQSSNAELTDQLEHHRSIPNNINSEMKTELEQVKGELSVALQEIKKYKSDIQLTEEDKIQHRIMKKKLDKFHSLERQVESLKRENLLLTDTAENSKLMKEKIEDLTIRLNQTEEKLQESRKIQEGLGFTERNLKQWRTIVYKLLDPNEKEKMRYENLGPDLLENKIAQIQQESLTLTESIESYKSKVEDQSKEILEINQLQEDQKRKIQTDKESLNENANLIKRFKRKLLLVSKERDSYKSVLESYEHELTFNAAAFEKDRIASVEESLTNYKETVEKLENLLAVSQSNKPSDAEMKLKEDISNLQQKIQELEHSLAIKGQQSTSDSKVLHFLNNPLQQATEARQNEVENLKAEIVSLKARIQLLEEGQTKDLTLLVGQKVDEAPSSIEVKQLQEQLQAAEIKKQRLIEAFKKTSSDFREVCYALTGFRIDGLNDGKYRLSPVYAENPNEYFLFQRDNSGECMLLENEYSSQENVQPLIHLHLQQQHSIPVFLAAVITDMFSRQTFDTVMEESSVSGGVTQSLMVQPEEVGEEEYDDVVGEEEEIVEEEYEDGEESAGEMSSHDSNDETDVEDDDNPVEEEENDSSSDIVCID